MKRVGYMTLCFKNDMEVTYTFDRKNPNFKTEVMFETATSSGFKTMVTDLNGNVLDNKGYSSDEVTFNINFTKLNKEQILSEIKEGWFNEPNAEAV
jgi:hypothetical protein